MLEVLLSVVGLETAPCAAALHRLLLEANAIGYSCTHDDICGAVLGACVGG